MTSSESLIERLEKATGPDRELDALIYAELDDRAVREAEGTVLARARKPPHDECVLGWVDPGLKSRNFRAAPSKPPIPHFTASIDAALTLMPEGCRAYVWVTGPAPFLASVITPSGDQFTRSCATPALAMTAAALKARKETD